MKQKLLSAAVLATLAVAANSAFALAPGAFDPTTIPQVYMSGATAQNGGIDNVVRLLCADTTLDAYATAKQVVYVCNAAAGTTLTTAGFTAGNPIAIHKESNGGSGNGLAPVRDATTLGFVDLSPVVAGQTVCTVDTASSVVAQTVGTAVLAAKTVWNCTNATVAHAPDIGFSDVDPAVFNTATASTVVPGNTLSVFSPNQLIFGVPVTIAFRNALQKAQGLTVGSDLIVDTPSLTNAQIAGIYTGRLNTAAKIDPKMLTTSGTPDTTPVYLLRRGTSSGTQKTAEVIFLNGNITNAANTTNGFKAPTAAYNSVTASTGYVAGTSAGGCGDATLAPATTTVFAGSANEEVVNCFNRHNLGGRYAAGILTTEFNQFASPASSSAAIDTLDATHPWGTTGFRFVKVNGYLPTVGNVIRGNYEFFSEQVITTLGTGTTGTAAQVAPAIVAELGNATNVTTINNNFTKWTDAPAGEQTSGLVKPAASAACKGTFASLGTTPDSDPVNFVTKNPTGTKTANAIKPALAVCPPRF